MLVIAAAAAGLAMTIRRRRGTALLALHVALAAGAVASVLAAHRGLGGAGLAAFAGTGVATTLGTFLLATPTPPRWLRRAHGGAALATALALAVATAA